MIDTEAGKISASGSGDSHVRRGTSTIPPPAPNKPFIAPAQTPQIAMGTVFFLSKNQHLLWEFSPYEVFLCAKIPCQGQGIQILACG